MAQHDHISQIHPDGSGWADCFEASLERYLRERSILDPNGDPLAQLAAVAATVRGEPDTPGNPYTSLAECERGLVAYGLQALWSTSLADAAASPWAICLVDAYALSPAQYPSTWLGNWDDGTGDHFILWLPGTAYMFNDPLAYLNGQQDCWYSPASVAAAFRGAYLLPGAPPDAGTPVIAPHPQPQIPPIKATSLMQFGLKARPDHTSNALIMVPAGVPVTILAQRRDGWDRLVAGHYIGYAPAIKVQPRRKP